MIEFLKVFMPQKVIREGEEVRKWYLGFAYWDYNTFTYRVAPIPLNFIYRFLRFIRIYWDKMRFHIPNYDRELMRAYYAGQQGFGIENIVGKKKK